MYSKSNCRVQLLARAKLEAEVFVISQDKASIQLMSRSPRGPGRGRSLPRVLGTCAGAANNKETSVVTGLSSTLARRHCHAFDPLLLLCLCEDPHSKLLQWQKAIGNSWELLLASGNVLEFLSCGSCALELLGGPDLT